ncbi:MAG: cyclic nucleotide-binding domain-containing protein [Eubacteriales bacterium]|nr:cyclic nucleotide-binding domain-containing protein [Eubacteriales bacterium]
MDEQGCVVSAILRAQFAVHLDHDSENCSVRTYAFGERVIAEGLPSERLLLVAGGRAKVGVDAPNGKSVILCFYISEGLMGEAELFSGTDVGSTSVTALENFRCIAVPLRENRKYLEENLTFVRIAAQELAKKLVQSTERVVENTLYGAEARLCRYILGASEKGAFRDVMTDVACSVGVSYRHLYRMMEGLCKEGILEKTGAGYRICDRERLLGRLR